MILKLRRNGTLSEEDDEEAAKPLLAEKARSYDQ